MADRRGVERILDKLVDLAYSAAATEHAAEQGFATKAAKDIADEKLAQAYREAVDKLMM